MIDTFPLIVADMIRNFPPQHFTYAGREIEKVEGVLKSLREDGNIGEKQAKTVADGWECLAGGGLRVWGLGGCISEDFIFQPIQFHPL